MYFAKNIRTQPICISIKITNKSPKKKKYNKLAIRKPHHTHTYTRQMENIQTIQLSEN